MRAAGFGADVVPSIHLGILDSSEVVIPVDTQDTGDGGVGIAEKASFQLNAYPNPTKDEIKKESVPVTDEKN